MSQYAFSDHRQLIRRSLAVVLGLVVVCCGGPVLLAQPLGGSSGQAGAADHVPGEVLLKFRPEVSPAARQALLSELGMTVISHNRALDVYRVAVSGLAEEAVEVSRADPRVEWVQLHPRVKFEFVPNDPLYRNVSGVKTDWQRWYLGNANLKAEAAWHFTRGRPDVVIAIIDSGVALNHPDLAANIWTNPGEVPGNGIDDDDNGFVDDVHGWDFCSTFHPVDGCLGEDDDPNPSPGDGVDNDGDGRIDEGNDHGTAVAGAAGAASDNGIGIAGAAHRAKLMVLKIGDDDSIPGLSAMLDAIVYAADNGAHVINLSVVFGGLGVNCATALPAVEAAVTYAFNRGVVVVAGAGNDNAQGPRAPASCTHALAVGGSGSGNTVVGPGFPGEINERASFSNFGRAPGQSHGVDVVAPAVHIAAPRFCTQGYVDAGVAGCTFAGETPSDRIVLASGNSLSGPLVAGLAALIISRARDLGIDITPGQVKDIIRNTARNLPNDPNDTPDAGASWDGKGRVDFLRAVLSVWPSTLGRR